MCRLLVAYVEGGMECALIGVHCLLRVGWSVHCSSLCVEGGIECALEYIVFPTSQVKTSSDVQKELRNFRRKTDHALVISGASLEVRKTTDVSQCHALCAMLCMHVL